MTDDEKNRGLEVSVAEAKVRIDSLLQSLDGVRHSISASEERMTETVERLSDRLEQYISRIDSALSRHSIENETRIKKLEAKSGQIQTLATFGTIVAPMIVALFMWNHDRGIRFTPDEVLDLREEIKDLRRHRRLGGRGIHWISPDRRLYDGGRNGGSENDTP